MIKKSIYSTVTIDIFAKREANGKKVFWGRGNGWCLVVWLKY